MFKFGGSKPLFGAESSGVGPKKADAASAIEAVAATLAAPFTRRGATRELRAGVARATVRMLRAMKRPYLEKSSTWLLHQLLALLGAPGGGRQLTECVTHMVRAGLGETLSERGQLAIATALATAATAKSSAEATTLVALEEVSSTLSPSGRRRDRPRTLRFTSRRCARSKLLDL
mgnify:FL=1